MSNYNEEKASFNKNGVVLLKNFFDIEKDIVPIQYGIYKIIGIVIEKYNLDIARKEFNSDNFDEGYAEIIRINRSYGSEIYDAIKMLPSFYRVVSNERNENLYKYFIDSDTTGIAMGSFGIRIDNPHEDKYATDWHQEYLAHMRSPDGVVFWVPLQKTTVDMGAVKVLAGSHAEGVLKLVDLNTDNNPSNSQQFQVYAKNQKIKDIDSLVEKYQEICPESDVGDLIVLDYRVIHKSGSNISNKSRWSMQLRYFNYESEEGKKIHWAGGLHSGVDVKKYYSNMFE